MITVSFVVKSIIVAFIISFVVIIGYYLSLKKNSYDMPKRLKNTDIPIANGIEDIKIICK